MTEDEIAALLARRFGYGPAGPQPADAAAILAALAGPDAMQTQFPIMPVEDMMARNEAYRAARRANPRVPEDVKAGQRGLAEIKQTTLSAGLARIVATETPFRERLVWFWADHFTARSKTALSRGMPAHMIDSAIRPNLSGPFAEMLFAAETHPAMVTYLDQQRSVGPESKAAARRNAGLNENLGREILELHTVGVDGGYTQQDVRQLALLLTGLMPDFDQPFRASRAEPGAETVLGASYGGGRASIDDIRAVLDDLAVKPATARHLSRKLAVHFVADDPPADLVEAMTAAYQRTGGRLDAVYEVLLTHPAALLPATEKARQPFEFVAASMRALGMSGAAVAGMEPKMLGRAVLRPLTVMGQPFMEPEGPNGWDEAADTWLTAQGIAARIVWGMRMPGQLVPDLPDPRAFAQTALGALLPEDLALAVSRAPSQGEAIGLVLASPAFNTR